VKRRGEGEEGGSGNHIQIRSDSNVRIRIRLLMFNTCLDDLNLLTVPNAFIIRLKILFISCVELHLFFLQYI
jgi:hypothetical protein